MAGEGGQAIRDELGIPAQALVIGNIAFDAAFKGVDVLLAAVQEMVKHRRDVYLLQVGVDPAVSPLQSVRPTRDRSRPGRPLSSSTPQASYPTLYCAGDSR
jgi:hypothetical protein